MLPLRPFIVGIDCGTSTGICVWTRSTNKYQWATKDFVTVQEMLMNTFGSRKDDVKIFVEVPEKMLYGRNESGVKTWELRIMYDAGGNRREALLLSRMLRHNGFMVEEVKPIREKKWDPKRLKMVTGSNARSNEHERDAVRLVAVHANKR